MGNQHVKHPRQISDGGESLTASNRKLGVDSTKFIHHIYRKPKPAGSSASRNDTDILQGNVGSKSVSKATSKPEVTEEDAQSSPSSSITHHRSGLPKPLGSAPSSRICSPKRMAVERRKSWDLPTTQKSMLEDDSGLQKGHLEGGGSSPSLDSGAREGCPVPHGGPAGGQASSSLSRTSTFISSQRPMCPVVDMSELDAHSTAKKEAHILNWSFLQSQGIFPYQGAERDSSPTAASSASAHSFGLSPGSSPPYNNTQSSQHSQHSLHPWCSSSKILPGAVQEDGLYVTPTGWQIFPAPPVAASPGGQGGSSGSEMQARRLISAIHRVHNIRVNEHKPRLMFNAMLSILLEVTDSTYGFISSVHQEEDDTHSIYMKVHASASPHPRTCTPAPPAPAHLHLHTCNLVCRCSCTPASQPLSQLAR
eukprot:jgi/Mesen1/10704/ME000090S10161